MYQYLKKLNHFAKVGGGYVSLFFQQLTAPEMGFSIRLSHRHLNLICPIWASLSPSLLPDLLHLLGPPLSWMSPSPIQVSKPGIWLHAGVLPLLCPAQVTSLPASPMDSVSCDSLHLSSPPAPLLELILMSSEPYLLAVLLWLLFTPTLLLLQTPTWKKTFQKCTTVHIGWCVSKRRQCGVFFFCLYVGW